MKSAYDLADPDDARRFLNDDPAGEYRWQPPGSEPIYVDQLASLLQFTEPRPDSHTLTGDEAPAGLTLLATLRDWLADAEPDLIDAARRAGVTWEDLAPVLRVADRRAAPCRSLRVEPADMWPCGDTKLLFRSPRH
ncbi:hypothetical protein [Streptosporangium lutulentum]|uniref:Uncharacterized protein n=1 Tax=Streptosporangium lutulentum TaxID=1461250 RepID=A0ABT9QC42_9ACTN|nr:hypothetical protein [Streptosporangium lutulentum]MDP9843619.1 hypothetical protein [Streptosporangium lutulentum]